MLHDLYLLSCYFDPSQALLCEEDLEKRYGQEAVREALLQGWIELCALPAFVRTPARLLCRLTDAGIGKNRILKGVSFETGYTQGAILAILKAFSL